MNYKDIVRTARAIFKEKYEPLLRKNFEGDVERKEAQITQWKFWYVNHFAEGAEWASEQYAAEKRDLLGLVNMLTVDETNQTVIEDLKSILEL
jgi:hypothetical protein